MKYLVTGGAGFIGSHLTNCLRRNGHIVRVLDNFSTGKMSNLAGVNGVEIVRGDIRDERTVVSALADVDGIFHLAALVSVPQSIDDPALNFEINVRGTQMVFDCARQCGVRNLVFTSSAAVYGDNDHLPLHETDKLSPMSPYALAKRFGEELGELYSDLFSMRVRCFRFFNVFGPRQDPASPYSGVISKFIDAVRSENRAPVVFGTGQQTRDFIYVADVAVALVNAMEQITDGFALYNLASGSETTVLELLSKVQTICGTAVKPELRNARDGDIFRSLASVKKIQVELGFNCRYTFDEGLSETMRWYDAKFS